MAVITLGQARKLLAPYAGKTGKCPDSDETRLFVMEVIQRLLHKGVNGNLRKWNFCTDNCYFTAPHDMDVPVKVTVDGYPDSVWSKWYEFFETAPFEAATVSNYNYHSDPTKNSCYAKKGLIEDVNRFYTIYDLPECGAKIYALPLVPEADDAHIIIQGVDIEGRDVYIEHKGTSTHGEYISISKSSPKRSQTIFKKITGIQKTKTKNYVRLYWQTPSANGLLAEYRPEETQPSFRRFKVHNIKPGCPTKLIVLGRIKDPDYHYDNDVLPIFNSGLLKKIAQEIQAEDNDKIDVANYKRQVVDRLIDDENYYKRTGEESFDFIYETSPGSNENLI